MKRRMTSIRIPVDLREKLKKMKIHPAQPYYEVIEKLLKEWRKGERTKQQPQRNVKSPKIRSDTKAMD